MSESNEYSKFYPLVSFHFRVEFTGVGDNAIDNRFQSVSGLNFELETETRKEGGENRFEHVLPVRTKYPNLVLKRGMIKDSGLKDWVISSLNALSGQVNSDNNTDPLIQPKNLTVSLLNEKHNNLITWNIVRAWPKKWSISDLNAEQNSIAIESLEFNYQYFTVQKN